MRLECTTADITPINAADVFTEAATWLRLNPNGRCFHSGTLRAPVWVLFEPADIDQVRHAPTDTGILHAVKTAVAGTENEFLPDYAD